MIRDPGFHGRGHAKAGVIPAEIVIQLAVGQALDKGETIGASLTKGARMRWVVTLLFGLVVAMGGWMFNLSGAVGEAKATAAAISEDQKDFKKTIANIQDAADRLERVEEIVKTLALEKISRPSPPSGAALAAKKSSTESAKAAAFEGIWDVRFQKGSTAEILFRAIDDKTMEAVGTESKGATTLRVKGSAKVTQAGQLEIGLTVTPDGGEPYTAETYLWPAGSNILRGFFKNTKGEFDTLTLTKRQTP